MGRYLRVVAEGGARVVGMDLSGAVIAAKELTAEFANVAVVKGDLLRTPFAEASFDHIYSLGVLDHTPDPRCAFLSLARLLKPGGRIVVWVYPRERARARTHHETRTAPISQADAAGDAPGDEPDHGPDRRPEAADDALEEPRGRQGWAWL